MIIVAIIFIVNLFLILLFFIINILKAYFKKIILTNVTFMLIDMKKITAYFFYCLIYYQFIIKFNIISDDFKLLYKRVSFEMFALRGSLPFILNINFNMLFFDCINRLYLHN